MMFIFSLNLQKDQDYSASIIGTFEIHLPRKFLKIVLLTLFEFLNN